MSMSIDTFLSLINELPLMTNNITNEEKYLINILNSLYKKAEIIDELYSEGYSHIIPEGVPNFCESEIYYEKIEKLNKLCI
jgi:hypothetical protein